MYVNPLHNFMGGQKNSTREKKSCAIPENQNQFCAHSIHFYFHSHSNRESFHIFLLSTGLILQKKRNLIGASYVTMNMFK